MHAALRVALWTVGILLLVVVLAALGLRLFDWNLVKDEIAAQLGRRLGTKVAIAGDLDIGVAAGLLTVQARGVRVDGTLEAAEPLLALERLEAGIALAPLLRGDVVFDRIALTRPRLTLIREGDGDVNWDFGRAPDEGESAGGPVLPPVRQLVVNDGSVIYRDHLLDATVRATIDRLSGFLSADAASLQGSGRIAGRPLVLKAQARYLEPRDDWRVSARLDVADARLALDGMPGSGGVDLRLEVPEPAQLAFLPLPDEFRRIPDLRASGHIERRHGAWHARDLRLAVGAHALTGAARVGADGRIEAQVGIADARLSVTGSLEAPDLRIEAVAPRPERLDFLPLPDLPAAGPAALDVRIVRHRGHWLFEDLVLALGELRLDGDVRIEPERERPMIYATLHLNELPLPRADQRRDQLIPPVELPTDLLRLVDVRLDLGINRVTGAPVVIDDLVLELTLDRGRLVLRPVSADIAGGALSGQVIYDAGADSPSATVRLALRGLDLARLVPDQTERLRGRMSGRIELHGRGPTAQALAGNLDGQLLFTLRDGAIDASWVEALDLDLAEWLTASAVPGTLQTPIRCALVAFTVQDSVLSAEPVVIDTRDSVIVLEGQIGLATEQLKLTLEAYPKDPSALSIESSVRVAGTLLEPSVDVLDAETAGQGALALVLGALAGPLAALVPYFDPGLAKDQNCGQLLGATPQGPPPAGRQ
jgi:uncharacterized protein involved in outer membrane biogenesis